MNLRRTFVNNKCCIATALLATAGIAPAFAQQGKSLVSDWSSHHVVFSNPGSEMDALMNGHRQQWQNYINNPRYRAQLMKRSTIRANAFASAESAFSRENFSRGPNSSQSKNTSLNGLWTSTVASAGHGTPAGTFPAEYGADFTTPTCSDFVAFPVNAAGSSSQANLVVFNNLYSGTCSGTVPNVQSAYYVTDGGTIQTSPVLSEDGTKVAFVDSLAGGSTFYVLTLGTGGTAASPTGVASGTNAASLPISGMVTRSSPYVDYTNDAAYVGDDNGILHKFSGVFNGTPAEVTSGGWPFTVASSVALTGPVLDSGYSGDSGSEHIFVAGSNGNIYCVTNVVSGTATACSTASISVADIGSGSAGPVYEAPTVVPSASGTSPGWVFTEAVYTSQAHSQNRTGGTGRYTYYSTSTTTNEAVLMQANTNLASLTRQDMGAASASQSNTSTTGYPAYPTYPSVITPTLFSGDFDNTYYNGSYSGRMYFCGSVDTSGSPADAATYYAIPELYRVQFNTSGGSAGQINNVSARIQLATQGGPGVGCTPLTEFLNANQNKDYLFAGIGGYGNYGSTSRTSGTNGCVVKTAGSSSYTNEACVVGFQIGTSTTSATPTSAYAAYLLGGTANDGRGSSGIVIDNYSTSSGTSQIYFGNLETGAASQASQSGLN